MAWPRLLSRLVYPRRRVEPVEAPSTEEIDAWVESAEAEPFRIADERFVKRALALGVSSGMMLDLDSRLGLVAMKILWHEDGFLSIGVYGSLEMAERARATAEAWGLGERMFFQVGHAQNLKFKARYFDMVVSEGGLQTSPDPLGLLREIARVVKPGGAILLAQTARPPRFRTRRVLAELGRSGPEALFRRQEAALRTGYTRSELQGLIAEAGLERARVIGEGERLFIERRGSNDPSSWVAEREKYF